MPNRPPTYRPTRPTGQTTGPARLPDARPTAAARGYGSRWQRARLAFLAARPLCEPCQDAGRVVEATVVDHHVPHRGDDTLFWDESNWVPMCKRCHDRKTATEDGGFGRRPTTGGDS